MSDPTPPPPRTDQPGATRRTYGPHCLPLEIRFWSKVRPDTSDLSNGCWHWTGGKDGKGYPILWHRGRARGAHRIAWELRHAKPFPDGMLACHTCDNPLCVRPDHIFVGTDWDNTQDKLRKGRAYRQPPRTHCSRGHAMLGDNVLYEGATRKRKCRECRRTRDRQRLLRHRGARPDLQGVA